jgi:hypothetical protein
MNTVQNCNTTHLQQISQHRSTPKKLVFHDCTPKLQTREICKKIDAIQSKNQMNNVFDIFERIRIAADVKVPQHQPAMNLDHTFAPRRVPCNSNFTQYIGSFTITPSESQFRFPPCEYELSRTDVISMSTVPDVVKDVLVRYYMSETLSSIEYLIWSRLQSGFSNFVKNMKIGIFPENCWRLLFNGYNSKIHNSHRKSFINCVSITDDIEHKSFDLKDTGIPPLTTKFWYQKSFRHGTSGDIYCCTIHKITFSWNVRTHILYVSFNYVTEHLNPFTRRWEICG